MIVLPNRKMRWILWWSALFVVGISRAISDEVDVKIDGNELQSAKAMDITTSIRPRHSKAPSTASHPNNQLESDRRLLSIIEKSSCNSLPQMRQSPILPIPPTYFATFPGSGSRITRLLIKALTGGVLNVQNENELSPKENAVAVQTRYPHKSGVVVSWDREINRAIILIRNPLLALPNLFDELYQSKRHLPKNFQIRDPTSGTKDIAAMASLGEWISWRDRLFEGQLQSYVEFVRYWVGRYGSKDRLIISYEGLANDNGEKANVDAIRLAKFLGKVGEVPTIESEDVKCAWERIFKAGDVPGGTDVDGLEAGNDIETNKRRGRRRLDGYYIPHPKSINAEPNSRPFTTEQLRAMLSAVVQLAEELHTHSDQLRRVLAGYRDDITYALKGQQDASEDGGSEAVQAQTSATKVMPTGMTPEPRSFHIFSVIPPETQSTLVTNWLMGLFEPDQEFTKLVTEPVMMVTRRGEEARITSSIVTHTEEMNLMGLYKIYKPGYDEVFFVVSKSGSPYADAQINSDYCEYDNVLCLEHEEQTYGSEDEMEAMIHRLTDRFYRRFRRFFEPMGGLVGGSERTALTRLMRLESAMKAMQGEPIEAEDPMFGVHGGGGLASAVAMTAGGGNIQKHMTLDAGRLFYCGSSGVGENRNYSILGIFLANAFFPEFVGVPPNNKDPGAEKAILLTPESLNGATSSDFLVHHMHQQCDVDVLMFPGIQLHVNHPFYGFTAYGQYTPPADNIYTIGPYDEGPQSIRLPYAMMKWWVLVKGLGSNGEIDQPTMAKFFDPSARPKNSRKHFLLYVNSHYALHREIAVHQLSKIGQIYALGSCQGNIGTAPAVISPSRPVRCQPFAAEDRPASIIVPDDLKESNYFDRVKFQDFRFMLLMEDENLPGYITERIVDGFMSGTVPVYYGTAEVFDIFNPKSFIFYDINKPQEALDRIKYLEDNPIEYQKVLNEPILVDGERTIEKYFSFDDSIGNGMLKKRVREKLGFS